MHVANMHAGMQAKVLKNMERIRDLAGMFQTEDSRSIQIAACNMANGTYLPQRMIFITG